MDPISNVALFLLVGWIGSWAEAMPSGASPDDAPERSSGGKGTADDECVLVDAEKTQADESGESTEKK